jgi:cysteine-rich repeat protein
MGNRQSRQQPARSGMGGPDRGRPLLRSHVMALLIVSLVAVSSAAADDIALQVDPGPAAGQVTLHWTGTGVYFDLYRALEPATVLDPAHLLGTTNTTEWTDTPPDAAIVYYVVTPPYCGNGLRDPGEQCDDGNTVDLDGCSSACAFEQAQRAVYVKMQFGTDTTCTRNALGGAFTSTLVQGNLQTSLDTGVADGSFSVILAAFGAHDLTGTNDPSFQLGVLTGSPRTTGAATPYDGTSDLDWWYDISPESLTAARQPLFTLPASITGGFLTAGPGTAQIPPFVGATAPIRFAAASLSISVGATSTPLVSSGGPPGHLPSENLDPSLASYATCGSPNAAGAGHLCGNVTAQSLAGSPFPASLLSICTGYTSANTMLDLIVGGCSYILLGTLVRATQPDTVDPAVPAAGAGGPYMLALDAQKTVTTCKDRTGQTVDLATCLASAAYSSSFELATDRVIPK